MFTWRFVKKKVLIQQNFPTNLLHLQILLFVITNKLTNQLLNAMRLRPIVVGICSTLLVWMQRADCYETAYALLTNTHTPVKYQYTKIIVRKMLLFAFCELCIQNFWIKTIHSSFKQDYHSMRLFIRWSPIH